eukprot:COSAG02_NODE_1665_length_11425_cov_4.620872_2_plen_254_part_00
MTRWLLQGDAGYILLCSNQTKGWVASLKMEGSVRCVAFSPDSTTLISGGSYHFPTLRGPMHTACMLTQSLRITGAVTCAGDNGELFHWDLRTRRCRHRHADSGMSPLTCLDYSDTGQFLACGSRSGVVNIYDMTKPLTSSHPKPTATVDNLTTPVSSVLFNHDAQVCHFLPLSCCTHTSSHQSMSGYVKMRTLRLRAVRRSQSANWHSTLDDEISAIHFLSASDLLARFSCIAYRPRGLRMRLTAAVWLLYRS